MFKGTDIQTRRFLSEEEVVQINYIIKMRANRFIAAAKQEWLYPETLLKSTHWSGFGSGILFMPEPRAIHMGGEIIVGYDNGRSDVFGEYGHRPGQKGYKDERREQRETKSLLRFQAEFAMMHGKQWRGSPIDHFGRRGTQADSDEYHEYLLTKVSDPKWLRKHGRRTLGGQNRRFKHAANP